MHIRYTTVMWTKAPPLAVSEEQRKVLETWVRAHSTPQSVATRSRIILLSAEGVPNNRIAKELAISRPTVILWRERVAPATVQRIWDAHGLQPHRVETFKLSRDPKFVEKLTDVVGLYLNPPDKAIVLCV